MNLHQLRYLCQVSESGYNITTAARTLNTSQPGISKQLSSLERELGVEILMRRGNRIVGVTAPGKAVLEVARRVLNDIRNLSFIREEFGTQDTGRLVLATTHTHARHVLPDVIRRFRQRYPKVQLVIRQENATRVADLVASGEADLGVSAEPAEARADLLMLPCYRLMRSVIAPARHPLLRVRPLTLEAIARYPIITLDTSFTGGQRVLDTFAKAGLKPELAMTATDVDVIKSYVELGLGVAIVPSIAFAQSRDRGLRALDARHVFEDNVACIMLRRHHYLLPYMADFAQLISPRWNRQALDKALETGQVPTEAVTAYPHPKRRRTTKATLRA
ncbi:MAG TPA: LysR substrate-binding domain-containing protein [Burkholderiales bacterium]|jgi:LysR family cys regulon transcriptional activator|nr:LysR substrate-binding domain-containing protein [Burkholderiales bacterium]